jgi:hypothetical protein
VRVSQHDPHGLKVALWAGLQVMVLHLDRYHFTTWLLPVLLSLTLAKPWHNPHPLPALRRFTPSAPARIKQEECSSSFLGLCCFTLIGTYAQKGDVHCVFSHTALCQQIVPPRNMIPTHEAWVPLTRFGVVKSAFLLYSLYRNVGITNNHMWPRHHCSNFKPSILTCCR